MKKGKVLLAAVCCITLTALVMTGCSKELQSTDEGGTEAASPVKETEPTGPAPEEEPVPTASEVQGSYEYIDNQLKESDTVNTVIWSYNKAYVIYTASNPSMEEDIYIWKAGDAEAEKVEGIKGQIGDLIWSPDSRYVIADTGTSIVREGYIIDLNTRKIEYQLVYAGRPFWSPDSKSIAIAQLNDAKPNAEIELDRSLDIVILDIATKGKNKIAGGTEEYCFWVRGWKADGTLNYEKNYFNNPELTEKLIYSTY